MRSSTTSDHCKSSFMTSGVSSVDDDSPQNTSDPRGAGNKCCLTAAFIFLVGMAAAVPIVVLCSLESHSEPQIDQLPKKATSTDTSADDEESESPESPPGSAVAAKSDEHIQELDGVDDKHSEEEGKEEEGKEEEEKEEEEIISSASAEGVEDFVKSVVAEDDASPVVESASAEVSGASSEVPVPAGEEGASPAEEGPREEAASCSKQSTVPAVPAPVASEGPELDETSFEKSASAEEEQPEEKREVDGGAADSEEAVGEGRLEGSGELSTIMTPEDDSLRNSRSSASGEAVKSRPCTSLNKWLDEFVCADCGGGGGEPASVCGACVLVCIGLGPLNPFYYVGMFIAILMIIFALAWVGAILLWLLTKCGSLMEE